MIDPRPQGWTYTFDFMPKFELEENNLDTQEEMKILGLVLSNDLSWKANTSNLTQKAYNRLWMIKCLKMAGASIEDLNDISMKQIRSVLWNSGLTKEEIGDIESQKVLPTYSHE